jgi:hypothetical protein
MKQRLVAFAAAISAIALFPAFAGAHPDEAGELYIPWSDYVGQERAQELTRGAPKAEQPTPGAQDLKLVGNSDKDGTTNSDLAFNGNLVYSGNYGGFRILDVRGNQPRVVVDHPCNGPQNDVSFHKMGGKTFLFQSIDSGQTAEDCTSVNADVVDGMRVGYEGVRVFDVSNPAKPVFLDMIQTACGSHTHTLIPGKSDRRGGGSDKAYIYVSSYPLGSGITPANPANPPGGADFKACTIPHKKISIIEVSAPGGEFSFRLREQALADDTAPTRPRPDRPSFIACHDVQAFLKKDIALGSCAGESQIWDISNRWMPGIEQEANHTHLRRPADSFEREYEFMHSAFFSWDGKVVATMDETGGGVEARCFGSRPGSQDGYYYFYNVVEPGSPEPPLRSRYTIPRQQGEGQECVSHNANTIPVKGRYLASAAYYQGGVSVIDFTNVDRPREVAFADLSDATGTADEWSSFWYNGRIYSNSGLGREGPNANRGLDVYKPVGTLARRTRGAKRWAYSNPQTQEAWQAP